MLRIKILLDRQFVKSSVTEIEFSPHSDVWCVIKFLTCICIKATRCPSATWLVHWMSAWTNDCAGVPDKVAGECVLYGWYILVGFLSKARKPFELTGRFGMSQKSLACSSHSRFRHPFFSEEISWQQLRGISVHCCYTRHGFCLLKPAFGLGRSKDTNWPVSNLSLSAIHSQRHSTWDKSIIIKLARRNERLITCKLNISCYG